MKAIKVAIPVANWLLRLAAGIIVYNKFWKTAEKVDVESMEFYIALGMVVLIGLLLIGGLLKKNTLTIISGLLIVALSIMLVLLGGFTFEKLIENFVLASIGFFFVARGN